ncbi:MAG: S-adenosylmethionine decarboxylase [Nanoarchaeota archaeon]
MNHKYGQTSKPYQNGSGVFRRGLKTAEAIIGEHAVCIGFGPHLMLDGYGAERKKLEDLNLIYRALDELPSEIGMTKIMPPYVFRYSGVKPEDWGLSGFVLIAESHISIHTFPEKRFLSVDIFSCKNFDTDFAQQYVRKLFNVGKFESIVLDRGTEFPKDIRATADIIRRARKAATSPVEACKPLEEKL